MRGFTIDDSHLFCRPDQVKEEFKEVIDLTLSVFSALGFDTFKAQVSLRDPENKDKYTGDDALWDQAEQAIRQAYQLGSPRDVADTPVIIETILA